MPVIDASIRYRKSIFYDDQIEIKVTIPEMPGFRFETVYEIRRKGESEILATGSVTLCFIDSVKRRPMKAPDFILDPIRGIWEEDNEVNL